MNHIDRILCAFDHKQPDKVPKGEFVIESSLIPLLIEKSSGDFFRDTLDVLERFNVDCTGVEATETRTPIKEIIGHSENGRPIVRDGWGAVYLESDIGTLPAGMIECPITHPHEVYDYGMPPLSDFDEAVQEVKKWVERSDYFVFANIWSPFSGGLTELMGWENYMLWTLTNTEELLHLTKHYAVYQAELAKRYIDAGVHGILIAGDLAGNGGPFFHPEIMRRIVFPHIKMQVDIIKKHRSVPVVYHSDGDINKLMNDFVATGIDGLNPLEPHARMDLGEIKKKYGDRLCLLGNVDTNYILPRGTPEEVARDVERVIDSAYWDGGLILQTANMLTPDIPIENIQAMFNAAENYRPVSRGSNV